MNKHKDKKQWRYLRTANNIFLVFSLLLGLSGFWLATYGAEHSKGSKNAKSNVKELNHSLVYARSGTGGGDDGERRPAYK